MLRSKPKAEQQRREAEAKAEQQKREAKAKAEKQKREIEAKLWQPTWRNVRNLAFACERRLKPMLKDPSSLRVLDKGMSSLTDTHVTVWVDYNAINGFGGRTRNTYSCTYTR